MTTSKQPSAAATRQKRYRERQKAAQSALDSGKLTNTTTDFATLVRDKAMRAVEAMPDELILDKGFSSGINTALKAQGLLDKREQARSKQQNAELAFAILALIGERPAPLQLEDGLTVEGTAVEVE